MQTLNTARKSLPYADAVEVIARLTDCNTNRCFLLESLSVSERYGRLSLAGLDPILELIGSKETCTLKMIVPDRAKPFFDTLKSVFSDYLVDSTEAHAFTLHIPLMPFDGQEQNRFERMSIAQVIRKSLSVFKQNEKNFLGWYGPLAYRFVYLFEDVERLHHDPTPDFRLFLYDTFLLFNHLTQECTVLAVRQSQPEADGVCQALALELSQNLTAPPLAPINLKNTAFNPDESTFIAQVEQARDLCRQGELMELVLSRLMTGTLEGKPFDVYRRYRVINPSPYLFYFNLGEEEVLLGASPEMMLRVENNRAQLRPISGTVGRGKSAIEDHDNMLWLLNSEKEKAELDMLIDLGRNDLARVCKPGIKIEDYRYVEKYSHVMHTVAQLSGELLEGMSGFDALVAALNAGTLTGAPKLAAMRYIEQIETGTRGYYGGAAGYFLFSGEVDTAIIIRSAHIQKQALSYRSGATLLYDSVPQSELNETRIKAGAFAAVFALNN